MSRSVTACESSCVTVHEISNSIKLILVLLLIVFQLFNINKGENKDVYL